MLSTLPVVPSVGNTLSQAVYLTSYFTICVILLMCAYTMCDFVLEHSSYVCIYQFCTLASLQQVDVFVNVPSCAGFPLPKCQQVMGPVPQA